MNIVITEGMRPIGHIEVNVTDYNKEQNALMAAKIMREILSLTDGGDFHLSIDVYDKIKKGKGA